MKYGQGKYSISASADASLSARRANLFSDLGVAAGSSMVSVSGRGLIGVPAGAHGVAVHVRDPDVPQIKERMAALQSEIDALRATVDELRKSKVIQLSALGDTSLRLRMPLAVVLDWSGEQTTAHAVELEDYGVGDSEYDALDDLRGSILQTYEFLRGNEADLGPTLVKQLRRFREVLVEQANDAES